MATKQIAQSSAAKFSRRKLFAQCPGNHRAFLARAQGPLFTATPRSIGAGALNLRKGCFRRAADYGSALSLGTAITISGAAVSPNMGYHSSAALSLLLTFFNVRLGAWLGNPGPSGASVYRKQGPVFSVRPLIQEALGLTTEDERYVYLSDGGHFENLGLYEMICRRCGLIIVSDAGCDPSVTFEDLGNAVRKISIDLGVRIVFELAAHRYANRPNWFRNGGGYHYLSGAKCTPWQTALSKAVVSGNRAGVGQKLCVGESGLST